MFVFLTCKRIKRFRRFFKDAYIFQIFYINYVLHYCILNYNNVHLNKKYQFLRAQIQKEYFKAKA